MLEPKLPPPKSVLSEHGIEDTAFVGDPYVLGADRRDRQSGEKDSVTKSHGQLVIIGLLDGGPWD